MENNLITKKYNKNPESFYKGLCFIIVIFVIIFIVFLLYFGIKKWKDKVKAVQCPETNETFIVQNNHNEPEWVGKEAARRLGILAKKADTLVIYMHKNKLPDPEIANRLAKRWKKIRQNSNGLRETSQVEETAAYTVNKGEELRICIRDTSSNKMFQDLNTGFMVLLHELAHLMSVSYGHQLEFKQNFAYISKIAVQLGLYDYVDYSKKPTNYCGTDITYPPF